MSAPNPPSALLAQYGQTPYELQPGNANFMGARLTQARKGAIFTPFSQSHKSGGVAVNKEDESVLIKIIHGASRQYPNDVKGTKIKYCSPPQKRYVDVIKKCNTVGSPIRVLLCAGSNGDYDNGYYFVTGEESHVSRGKTYLRFVLERCLTQKADVSTYVAPSPPTLSAPLPPPPPSMDHDHDDSDPAPPAKRMCMSTETFYNDVWYDSRLEARHGILWDKLGVTHKDHHAGSIPYTQKSSGTTHYYYPDAQLYDCIINGEKFGMVYVEIKPKYPYDEELRKCEEAVKNTRTPFLLFYGDMCNPFGLEPEHQMKLYGHGRGTRALFFTGSGEGEGYVTEYMEVVWGYDEQAKCAVLHRRKHTDDMRWAHEIVADAFKLAARHDFSGTPAAVAD